MQVELYGLLQSLPAGLALGHRALQLGEAGILIGGALLEMPLPCRSRGRTSPLACAAAACFDIPLPPCLNPGRPWGVRVRT